MLVDRVSVTRTGGSDIACWYREHAPAIRAYVASRTGNRVLADDCTSQVFLRACAGRGSFHDRGAGVRPWLFTIARNVVYDQRMSNHRRHELTVDLPDCGVDPGPSPEKAVLDRELSRALARSIDQLPSDQARCIRLRYLHEKSVSETARAMDRAETAVRALQYRAIRGLRTIIAAD